MLNCIKIKIIMNKLFFVIALAILVLSANVNAQTSIVRIIDLNDTTSTAKQDVDVAKAMLKKFGNIATYGSDIKADLDSSSTIEVWQLENVKSRVSGGATTQYLVKFTVGGKERVIVTHEDPTTKLDTGLAGSSGCYCFSVKQGDDDGSDVDPALME
jgi:hypothetical protein